MGFPFWATHSQVFLLRTNKSLCGPVGLRPLPADHQPSEVTLPGVTAQESEQEVTLEEVDDTYQSADQLGAELVTLSLLPESRWKSLLHLDVIKVSVAEIKPRLKRNGYCDHGSNSLWLQRRNKPVAPPAAPAAAPFFLPTLPGLMPQFAAPSETGGETKVPLCSVGFALHLQT